MEHQTACVKKGVARRQTQIIVLVFCPATVLFSLILISFLLHPASDRGRFGDEDYSPMVVLMPGLAAGTLVWSQLMGLLSSVARLTELTEVSP